MKLSELKTEAVATTCQTPGAIFKIHIEAKKIRIEIKLPETTDLSKEEAKLLEQNIHNALELVLKELFK